MKFSKMCDYKGVAHFIVKTGRKNIRILLPGQPYEKSFVVPIKKIANRRPAEYEPEDNLDDDGEPEGDAELTDAVRDLEDERYQPQ
jgi:hypothetical protein